MRKLNNGMTAAMLLVAFALSGCELSETRKALAHATALKTSLVDFEQERTNTVAVVAKSEQTLNELGKATTAEQVATTSEAWEKSAEEMAERVTALKERFDAVTRDGELFFQKLDEEARGVKNPGLRSSSEEKNRLLKVEWVSAHLAAAETIGKLDALGSDNDDIGRVIRMASMRSQLKTRIGELRKIADESRTALTDLAKLTNQGNELLRFAANGD